MFKDRMRNCRAQLEMWLHSCEESTGGIASSSTCGGGLCAAAAAAVCLSICLYACIRTCRWLQIRVLASYCLYRFHIHKSIKVCKLLGRGILVPEAEIQAAVGWFTFSDSLASSVSVWLIRFLWLDSRLILCRWLIDWLIEMLTG